MMGFETKVGRDRRLPGTGNPGGQFCCKHKRMDSSHIRLEYSAFRTVSIPSLTSKETQFRGVSLAICVLAYPKSLTIL